MTVLGLKLSRRANAVSALHGHVSRRMWAHLWPWRVEEEIPIGHITNGVHIPSWLAWQTSSRQIVFTEHLDGCSGIARVDLAGGVSQLWKGAETIAGEGGAFAVSASRDRQV